MAKSYIPLLIILGVTILNAVGMAAASHILNPRRPHAREGDALRVGNDSAR